MSVLATIAIMAASVSHMGAGERFKDCSDCPEMVVIPAGAFQMGRVGGEEGRPEGPVHLVTIQPFALASLETTVADFARFVEATGHQAIGDCRSWDDDRKTVDYRAGASWRNPTTIRASEPQEPVGCVSWEDAQAYARWMSARTGQSYRLPTEAEWEYAAHAGSAEDYAWGNDPAGACLYANVYDLSGLNPNIPWEHHQCEDGAREVAPVGSYRSNAFGLYDMTGNVWEWVEDCYRAPYPEDVPVDGTAYQVDGQCDRRSVRGGSWITATFRNRPAWRGRDPEDFRTWIFGFRLARDFHSAPAE